MYLIRISFVSSFYLHVNTKYEIVKKWVGFMGRGLYDCSIISSRKNYRKKKTGKKVHFLWLFWHTCLMILFLVFLFLSLVFNLFSPSIPLSLWMINCKIEFCNHLLLTIGFHSWTYNKILGRPLHLGSEKL